MERGHFREMAHERTLLSKGSEPWPSYDTGEGVRTTLGIGPEDVKGIARGRRGYTLQSWVLFLVSLAVGAFGGLLYSQITSITYPYSAATGAATVRPDARVGRILALTLGAILGLALSVSYFILTSQDDPVAFGDVGEVPEYAVYEGEMR